MRINGRKETLHSLWDTALVELEQGTPAEIASRIQSTVTVEDRQQWLQGTAADWALESLAVVRTRVYRLPASGEITADYTDSARAVIRVRLAQAGARLGLLLNQTFSNSGVRVHVTTFLITQKLSGQGISNSGKNRRMTTILLLVSFVLATYQFAEAQQATKIPQIGYLERRSPFRSHAPHGGVPSGIARAWL